MVKNFTIGRYLETHSKLHKLDPRTKLVSGFAFITLLLNASTWFQHILLIIFTLILIKTSKISAKIFLRGLRPILNIVIITSLIQLLTSGGGHVYFTWGFITISEFGARRALVIFLRFTLIIVLTSIIGLTTKPFDLTMGLSKLLAPLKLIKIRVDDLALMLAIALRFIPTLVDETEILKRAQQSRGIQFDEGNFFVRMAKLIPLLIPVYIRSFYRAEELANALDVKGYISGAKRTQFRPMNLHATDFIFFIILLILTWLFLLLGT